jgi:hypothetical protein
MPRPAIYLDECVDQYLAPFLRQRDFSVATPREADLLGASDGMQLAFATQRQILIVTYNCKHFRSLHHQYLADGRSHNGILIVSSRPINRFGIRVAIALDWIAMLPDYRSMLFRWNDFQQRLIRGKRILLSNYTEEDVRRALGHPA